MLWVVGAADVAADRDLHVPAGVPDVPRAAARRRSRGAGSTPRTEHPRTPRTPACTAAPSTRHRHRASARRAAGDGALRSIVLAVGSVARRLRRACRRRSAAATGSTHFLEPSFAASASRRGGEAAARRHGPRRSTLMVRVDRRRARRDRHRGVLLPEEPRARPTPSPSGSPACTRLLLNKYYVDEIYDAAIVQPIRIVSRGGAVEGRRRRRDRRRGQRRRPTSSRGVERSAAAAADRLGARLRGVAVPRRRDDARVLPVALSDAADA